MSTDPVRLIHGSQAHELLTDTAFVERWWRLYHQAPWSTANQRPDFAIAWYQAYRGQFEPLLAILGPGGADCAGLFTLAEERGSGRLTVAGDHQIDYAAWLCDADLANQFAVESLRALGAKYPGGMLRLRYLAAAFPTEWLGAPREWGGSLSQHSFARPLLKLDDVDRIARTLRKKSNKSRLNRLKRLGPVEIHTLANRAELEASLDDIAIYCDLRQGAISNSLPFWEDARKRPFHLNMMEADGLLYCTVMRVGGELAAAIINLCSTDSAAIGLFAISPFYAKHSPGKLLLYETALRLAEDGYKEVDLTPGGDDWKNRFADDHDTVLLTDIRFGRWHGHVHSVRSRVEVAARGALSRAEIQPRRLKAIAARLLRVRLSTVFNRLDRVRRWLWHTQESRVYYMEANRAADLECGQEMEVDRAEHLLYFVPLETWQSHSAFLSDSLARLTDGEHLYSRVEDGVLVHHGWFDGKAASSYFPEIGEWFEYPEGSAVLYDFFTDARARGRGLYQHSLRQMLRDAAAKPEFRRLYISVRAENGPSRSAVEKVGFRHEQSLLRQTRFGVSRTSRRLASAPGEHHDASAGGS